MINHHFPISVPTNEPIGGNFYKTSLLWKHACKEKIKIYNWSPFFQLVFQLITTDWRHFLQNFIALEACFLILLILDAL
jgi:hypothetical protein